MDRAAITLVVCFIGEIMKLITACFYLIFCIQANALTVTTLNIEWFGRGGVISGSSIDEYRIQRLRDFLLYQLPASDVLVFQEITEVELLQGSFPEYDCKTYRPRANHQHVVLCALNNIKTDFFEIEDVDLGSYGLRPGSGLKVPYGKRRLFRKRKKLNIIGVHLKAGRFETDVRLEQIKEITKSGDLGSRTLIIGDFNSYPAERTEREVGDEELINLILSPLRFKKAQYEGSTFLSRFPRRFDHAWYRGIDLKSTAIYGPCKEESVPRPYDNFSFYNRFISDHCALQLVFE
jgi:hypothetical protein